MNKPITIAGGGLSGLALGITLARHGVDVEVHDAGTYPRHRVCGEVLSGVAEELLDWLDVKEHLSLAPELKSLSWFMRGKLLKEIELPSFARGISRYWLDDTLRERLELEGGRLIEKSRLAPESKEGFVWTAGHRPDKNSKWLGLKIHLTDCCLQSDIELHLGQNAYIGLAKVEGNQVNACGLFRINKNIKEKGLDLLLEHLKANALGYVAEQISKAMPDKDSFQAIAGFAISTPNPRKSLLSLGDAKVTIPPFTGNGMSIALESAALASGPLLDYARGLRDWSSVCKAIQARLNTRFRRRLFVARLLHPLLWNNPAQVLFSVACKSKLFNFDRFYQILR